MMDFNKLKMISAAEAIEGAKSEYLTPKEKEAYDIVVIVRPVARAK